LRRRLGAAPSDQAVRDALRETLPRIDETERRLNAGLAADLPKALRKRRYPMALDLTLLPYHGEPYGSPEEMYRGERPIRFVPASRFAVGVAVFWNGHTAGEPDPRWGGDACFSVNSGLDAPKVRVFVALIDEATITATDSRPYR
jgi:hypothetical protein